MQKLFLQSTRSPVDSVLRDADRARLLRTVLAFGVPLGLFAGLGPRLMGGLAALRDDKFALWLLATVPFWLLVYALSHTRFILAAIWLAVVGGGGMIMISVLATGQFWLYTYYLFLLMLGGILLPREQTVLVLFLVVLAIFIPPLFMQAENIWRAVLYPALLVLFGGILFLAVFEYQRSLERRWSERVHEYGLRFRKLLQDSQWGTATLCNGVVVECDEQFARLLGYPAARLHGMPVSSLVTSAHVPADTEVVEAEAVRFDGTQLPVEMLITDLRGDPEMDSVIALRDITVRKKNEEVLRRQAYRDPLTGLFNRSYLMHYLQLQLMYPSSREQVSVLFVDLDDFKMVNDRFGHPVGDRVLAQIGERLQGVVRDDDVVARYGGDEFVIVCRYPREITNTFAERTRQALRQPFSVEGEQIRLSVSVGVIQDIRDFDSVDAVLRAADARMYQDKYQRFPEKHPSQGDLH